jgi:hypothetical protein
VLRCGRSRLSDCDCVISVCGSVWKCVILEGFESVIRCVSTCVISKCVMQMVCVEVCASKSIPPVLFVHVHTDTQTCQSV